MKKLAIFIIVLLITGCGAKPDINGRKAYWENVIKKELPVGVSEADIKAWGKKRGIEFINTGMIEPKNSLTASAESIPDHSSVICDKWTIQITIKLNSKMKSIGSKVESIGSCL